MATKKSPKKKKKPVSDAAGGSLRIRMYNVGFGDCFLLTMPGADRDRRILVDCGTVAVGPHSMNEMVARVIKDCTDEDGTARIDVVVATHRHRDHVSGFSNNAWRAVEVGEVWMPWTEHPTDKEARRIRETQSKLALTLRARFAQYLAAPALSPLPAAQVQQLDALMLNALTNEAAMDMLHNGFAGKRKLSFLPKADATSMHFETDVLPGVTVYVLGPSRDPEVIRDMDPPAGKSYLRLVDGLGKDGMPEPFRATWHIADTPAECPSLTADDRIRLQTLNSEMELNVATSLDKAVNGTSLMLVFKIGSKHLLFPGDAQWGTWQSALKNADARALMERAVFYKVGHHGSHNATPPEYVEHVMGAEIHSMCSTKPGSYNEVPREPLLSALVTHHAHVARTDEIGSLPEGFVADGDFCADLTIPLD